MRLTAFAAVALFLATPFHADACAQDGRAARRAPKSDIVDTATAAGFTTLVAAIDAAGLVDELKAKGPFTVFAPTEEAFAALPDGALQSLLLPQNKEKLRRILRNHVVSGRLTSFEIGNIDVPQMAPTASRGRVSVSADARGFRYGDASVVRADIECSNGVVHVIDRVVMPTEKRTEDGLKMSAKEVAPTSLLDALRAVPDGRFSMFLEAVAASGADQDWAQPESKGSWTMFVPTNDAFERLSDGERAALLDPNNRDALRAVLDWHALPELQVWSFDFDLYDLGPAMVSRERGRFVLDILDNGMVFVYVLRTAGVARAAEEPFKARVLAGDIAVGGHIVHVVDRLMAPRSLEGKLFASQVYREKDVEELAAGAEAQENARRVLAEMVQQSESLGDEAALELYRLGLRLLEEVVPVSRAGTMLMMEDDRNDRAKLRARLLARIGDLDRVWFATFLKNRPLATSLEAPIPGMRVRTSRSSAGEPAAPRSDKATGAVMQVDIKGREPSVAAATVVEPQVRVPSGMSWCKVLQAEVDSAVVTDAALRDAITKTGLPWRVRDRASGIEMLLVPPGTFSMGKSPGDQEAQSNEVPAHAVTLTQPYYLGRYEVTREQWDKVIASQVAQEPAKDGAREDSMESGTAVVQPGGGVVILQGNVELRGADGKVVRSEVATETKADGTVVVSAVAIGDEVEQEDPTRPDLPVTAGFTKSRDYCRKLGLRLPTEAEWEFACRAGTDGPRYGNLDDIAWHRGNVAGQRKPVGGKAANALGFHDMIGNAWEWVNDWYGEYTRSPQTDPTGPATGTSRVMRGSFFNFEQGFCRASLRYDANSPEFDNGCGFRVARNP
jgi:transforming growth factor-beta-induced protein